MITFAEMVDKLDDLNSGEILELKQLIERKWVEIRSNEIAEHVGEARKESAKGETIVLSTPDEIKGYFSIMMSNED